ncbi:hypothetical protein WISP_22311 [Willisornis vidua]|uniref:Myb/SANT-like DNA-binding domain-containing protein n=1 Tax=Willisornis vidua TaxID=1566151 RepID=A0ABQ9DTA2_9PASS|nr:hypothetical protein WISP_22311 [Willisornis vidua]
MESGAGKHWTEEEVKALLSVWSEKNIRKQLHGTLRNKGIFIYIAKRLQELGVCRDWKQCRAKYKNLKYEYRTVKYAHNSGDVTKTMKFFHDLDAILRSEPVTQLAAEENGRCSATEPQLNTSPTTDSAQGEGSVSLEDDEDAPGDPLLFMSHVRPVQLGNPTTAVEASKPPAFIPAVANEGGKHWTVNEVRALIHIWSDKNIQQQLEGTVRNKRIFEQVASRLQKFGIDRDWKQCRTKYKNLKHEYKSVKSAQDSGSTSKSMKFFNELDAILGHCTIEQAIKSDNDESERPPEWTEAKSEKDSIEMPGDTGEEDSVSNMSEDLQVADIKKDSDSDDVTVNTTPENRVALHKAKETAMTKMLEDEGDFVNSAPAALEATQIKKETIDIDDDSISTTSEDRSCTPVAKQIVKTVGDLTANTGSLSIKRKTSNDGLSNLRYEQTSQQNKPVKIIREMYDAYMDDLTKVNVKKNEQSYTNSTARLMLWEVFHYLVPVAYSNSKDRSLDRTAFCDMYDLNLVRMEIRLIFTFPKTSMQEPEPCKMLCKTTEQI